MIDNSEFIGKVAIVTGGGRGMGAAVVERLGQGGASIVVNDIDFASAEASAQRLRVMGVDVIAVGGDIVSSDDVGSMVRVAMDRFGAIHILINNAGVLRPTAVIDIEEDEWDLVVDVNLKGTYMCSRAVLPTMRDSGWGRIVNFSSTAGKNISTMGGAHYTAAKAGILGFTRHLAKETAEYGITVNAVCPGLIETEMVRTTISPERAKTYADSFPISRLGQPSEVAELVAFLASDRAEYITGASLDINGGDLMI